jgi:murein L,D-transpeptidase YcbB/YkuD
LLHFGYDMPVSTRRGASQPDGIYGDETAATVRSFQVDQGLDADGVAGRHTLRRMDTMFVAEEIEARNNLLLDARFCRGSSGGGKGAL